MRVFLEKSFRTIVVRDVFRFFWKSENSTITNTGSITGGRYGFTPKSNATGITFTNKTGTINGSTYDIYGGSEDWGTFTNGQGGNDCVKYYSYLPATYKIYVASASSFGKMCNTAGTSYSRGNYINVLSHNWYGRRFDKIKKPRINGVFIMYPGPDSNRHVHSDNRF